MTTATRPYLFYDAVVSICTTCFRKIDGKIVFEGPANELRQSTDDYLRSFLS